MSTLSDEASDGPNSEVVEEEEESQPPLMLLLQLCAVSAVEGADIGLLPAVTFALQHDLHLRLVQIAKMSVAQAVTQAVAGPVWGVLADRRVCRRKTLLAIGAFIQGVCTIALGWTEDLAAMVIIRSINGAALASLKPICVGIVADTTSENARGKINGYLVFSMILGTMAATSICAPLARATICGIQGWRVAFAFTGAIAIFTSMLISVFMYEARHEKSWDKEARQKCTGVGREFAKFFGYFRMPTFVVMIGQGLFGCIPSNAFNYATLYFQVAGLPDKQAAMLMTTYQASSACGHLLGGIIGDALARRCPYHGRAFTANISVLSGIPCVFLIFMTQPSEEYRLMWYLSLLILMGLTSTWCATGVNLPLLSEIVDPASRSGIMAWETAMESAIAAFAGNAAVGFLAQDVFGYNLVDAGSQAEGHHNAEALGKTLALTSVLPWSICLCFYVFLHWAVPYDKRRIEEEKAKYKMVSEAQGQSSQSEITLNTDESDGFVLDNGKEEDENLEWLKQC